MQLALYPSSIGRSPLPPGLSWGEIQGHGRTPTLVRHVPNAYHLCSSDHPTWKWGRLDNDADAHVPDRFVSSKASTTLVTPISNRLRKRLGLSLRWGPRLPGWRERVVVLCYHSVHPSSTFPSSTSPKLFERHMRWLSEECDLIPFIRAWDERSRPNRFRPAVAVTFDDGFADNHTHALPTLLRYEIPATFFVTTGLIDRVGDVIQQRGWRGWSLEGSTLTWGQIIEMQRLGMEIGAHGHRHAILGRLDDEDVVSDLSMCKQILEERLEASISSIAYPKGRPRRDFSQRTTDLARTVGFENGAAVLFRRVRHSDSRMAIARFVVEEDSLDILRAKVWGKMDVIGLLQERAPMRLLAE